jgi:hypothetical protein
VDVLPVKLQTRAKGIAAFANVLPTIAALREQV